MATMPLPRARSVIADTSEGLEVIVPARRMGFASLFLPLWLCGWAVGEFFAIRQLLQSSGRDAFLLFWLLGWTVGGCFALTMTLWMWTGRERIVLRPDALVVRREILNLGRSETFGLADVKRLRIAPSPVMPRNSVEFWGLSGGLIAFDYGARTFRFGASLDEAEAAQIVERLRSRHAFAEG